ncbi:MAG: CYTH domain-containing protein [bacterium]
MLEVELKSVVDDMERRRAAIEAAGAALVFSGLLEDRRYDTAERSLTAADQVLRVRVYRDAHGSRAELDWKGQTRREGGYKLREELETDVSDGDTLVAILDKIGYVATIAIDREIMQYDLNGTMIRFERYPRMDTLVEVEGAPEQIEAAIDVLGMPRDGFTSERLADFAARFEARTGTRAALSHAALANDSGFDPINA